MATFAPVLLDGLLTRNPALETFPVRAGGLTVIELAGDDRVEIVDLYGGQVAEVTVLGAPVGLPPRTRPRPRCAAIVEGNAHRGGKTLQSLVADHPRGPRSAVTRRPLRATVRPGLLSQ